MLLTCERGREFKCRREGLEIFEYLLLLGKNENTKKEDDAGAFSAVTDGEERNQHNYSSSIEDELKKLRQKDAKKTQENGERPFRFFDTKCAGSAFILYTQPTSPGFKDTADDDNSISQPNKRAKPEDIVLTKSNIQDHTKDDVVAVPWDPFGTLQRIVQELRDPKSMMPSSRFISRMIPIQRTCFAKVEEIKESVQCLLVDTDAERTFAIHVKRRYCPTMTTQDIVKCVGDIVGKMTTQNNGKWSANLKDPDILIQIEVCKTLCGVSVIPRQIRTLSKNFNLAEVRANATLTPE